MQNWKGTFQLPISFLIFILLYAKLNNLTLFNKYSLFFNYKRISSLSHQVSPFEQTRLHLCQILRSLTIINLRYSFYHPHLHQSSICSSLKTRVIISIEDSIIKTFSLKSWPLCLLLRSLLLMVLKALSSEILVNLFLSLW